MRLAEKTGAFLVILALGSSSLLLACGDDSVDVGPTDPPDATPIADGGIEAGLPPLSGDAFFADPEADDEGLRADNSPGLCVASVQDADGVSLGCQDEGCAENAQTCCTGRADCCGAENAVASTDFSCADGICLDGATLFGSPSPQVQEAAFVPRGDSDYDSGALLPQVFDLRVDRVELRTTFGVPTGPSTCVEGRCIESAGVGFVADIPQGIRSHVRPLVALVWSAGEVLLISEDRVVQRWAGAGEWTLVSRPDGSVEVSNNDSGTATFDALIPPSPSAQVVLYGHNINPAAGALNARLESLSVMQSACETTRQWSEREEIRTFVASAGQDLVGVRSPSTARDGDGQLRVVYLRGNQLFATARADDNFPARWVTADEAYPAFDGEIAGPELSYEFGKLVLYYEQDGLLFRAEANDNAPLRFDSSVEITGFAAFTGAVRAPSVASRGDNGPRAMVVRVSARASGARDEIVAYTTDANSVVYRSTLPTAQLGDQVGDPEIFIRNNLHQVYVPYLRGTRWRIAHLVSEDFLNWNMSDDSALIREGDAERMGPRAPDVSQVEETPTRAAGIELFYERFDGITRRIGRAFRRTPSQANVGGLR